MTIKSTFLILLSIIISGCTTTRTIANAYNLKDMRDRYEWLAFDNRCSISFLALDVCRLQHKSEKECFKAHEKRVIDAYKEYEARTKSLPDK